MSLKNCKRHDLTLDIDIRYKHCLFEPPMKIFKVAIQTDCFPVLLCIVTWVCTTIRVLRSIYVRSKRSVSSCVAQASSHPAISFFIRSVSESDVNEVPYEENLVIAFMEDQLMSRMNLESITKGTLLL